MLAAFCFQGKGNPSKRPFLDLHAYGAQNMLTVEQLARVSQPHRRRPGWAGLGDRLWLVQRKSQDVACFEAASPDSIKS
jgi:hypothetical protein